MRAMPLRSIWQIVSEINLAAIQSEIETTFHLLIAADEEADAEQAARSLSDPAAEFVHPWITVTDRTGSGLRSQSTEIAPHSPSAHKTPSQQSRQSPDCALLVTTQPELSPDLAALLQALSAQSIPTLIVLFGPEGQRPDGAIARRGEQARVAVPNWSNQAVARVASALVDIVPGPLRLPLARRLAPLRAAAFNLLIKETSQANASYSFTTGLGETVPGLGVVLGAGDAIVLTKNQLMMAYKIALVSGKTGTPQKLLGEIVGVLGGGFLFRQIARQMSGLIPVWGIVPKVAVSYSGTWAIGRAVVLWATEGQRITPELMTQFYRDALGHGRKAAQRIADNARRPRLTDGRSAPKAAPKQAQRPAPKAVPKPAPKPAPKAAPKQAQRSVPKAAPKQAQRPVPKAAPKQAQRPVPKAAPKQAQRPAPKAAPKQAQRSVPKAAPKQAQRPVPKAAPKPAPKPAQGPAYATRLLRRVRKRILRLPPSRD